MIPLWPAAGVWLFIVLPQLAWNTDALRDNEWLELGRFARGCLWLLVRTWPYSRVYRWSIAWRQAFPEPERCPVCYQVRPSLRHYLDHFPGEHRAWDEAQQAYDDRYWTPPTDPAEAVRWLEERTPHQ